MKHMSLAGLDWEATAACFHFDLLMTVSHGGIKKSMNNKESASSLPSSKLHHCESSSGTACRLLQEKAVSAVACWLIVCAKTARFCV